MNFFNLISIAIGLSMDAFAVSICKGLCQKKMNWRNAVIIGIFFGFFQAFMPIIGYLIGVQFNYFISNFSHWIAFILLVFIGINMIRESKDIKQDEEVYCNIEGELIIDIKEILLLSIATSIDALAVGFSFALLNIKIFGAAGVIGITTFFLSTLGVFIGFKFGSKFRSKSEVLGGIILIIIGLKILLEGIMT